MKPAQGDDEAKSPPYLHQPSLHDDCIQYRTRHAAKINPICEMQGNTFCSQAVFLLLELRSHDVGRHLNKDISIYTKDCAYECR
jgi:hypothetical protein